MAEEAGAATAPARLLGLSRKGRIEICHDADLVLFTEDFEVCLTMIAGEIVFAAEGFDE